jgi:hydroxymethylpyrimidine pyrophosphatase-like HAD family hydrolase
MTRRQTAADPGSSSSGRDKLERTAARVLREVPGTALAADQPFRVSDFAIDYCEDVPPLSPESVDHICRILSEEGVHFKVSSIHVNFWLGSFDKLSGVRLFLSGESIGTLEDLAEQTVFIGDSPNDEPLFAGFAHSIAVGNLRRFLPRLVHMPEFLTERDSGEGFREAADAILARRVRPQ